MEDEVAEFAMHFAQEVKNVASFINVVNRKRRGELLFLSYQTVFT